MTEEPKEVQFKGYRLALINQLSLSSRCEVWRAEDPFGRLVIVKIRKSEKEQELRAFFDTGFKKARQAGNLRDCKYFPQIDVVETIADGYRQGCAGIVMEYFHSQTLRDYVRHGPLPMHRVWAIASQLARAIDTLEWKNLSPHGDIKPENVLVRETTDGIEIVLIDFAEDPAEITTSYSPAQRDIPGIETKNRVVVVDEKKKKIPPEDLNWRWDVYALGHLIYFMLTGKDPPGHRVERDKLDRMFAYLQEIRPEVKSKIDPVWQAIERAAEFRDLSSAKHMADLLKKAPGVLPPRLSKPPWRKVVFPIIAGLFAVMGTIVLPFSPGIFLRTTPTPTPTSVATATRAIETPALKLTSTPAPATPTPTSTATNTPIPIPTPTSTATNTPTPTSTATSTPTFTPTPMPTATGTPTPTPIPTMTPLRTDSISSPSFGFLNLVPGGRLNLTGHRTDKLQIIINDPEIQSYIIRYHPRERPVKPKLEDWPIIWRCDNDRIPCQRYVPKDQAIINVDWEWLRAGMKSGLYSLVLQVFDKDGQWVVTELSSVHIVVPEIP